MILLLYFLEDVEKSLKKRIFSMKTLRTLITNVCPYDLSMPFQLIIEEKKVLAPTKILIEV